jgi:hypothetical protein
MILVEILTVFWILFWSILGLPKFLKNKDEISQQKIEGKVSEKIKETSLISILDVLET